MDRETTWTDTLDRHISRIQFHRWINGHAERLTDERKRQTVR